MIKVALVQCPECKKEISDQACTCPNCGYSFVRKSKKTELSEIKKLPGLGFLFIIMGIGAIIGGCFLLTIFIGIFAIIGGFGFIAAGANYISGIQDGSCPYCNAKMRVKYKDNA